MAPLVDITPEIHASDILAVDCLLVGEEFVVSFQYIRQIIAVFSKKEIIEDLRLFESGLCKEFPDSQKTLIRGILLSALVGKSDAVTVKMLERSQKDKFVYVFKIQIDRRIVESGLDTFFSPISSISSRAASIKRMVFCFFCNSLFVSIYSPVKFC